MQIQVHLGYQKGFSWKQNENISFIGYGYNSKNTLLSSSEAINYFSKCQDLATLKEKVEKFNGVFSLIIELPESVICICDKSRFFPIFYTRNNGHIYISDNFYELVGSQKTATFNKLATTNFIAGTFTSGSSTLIQNINSVQAGEIIELAYDDKNRTFFNSSIIQEANKPTYSSSESVSYFNNAANRLINSIQNKQVLLPLSGGYDSRLIACWLKEAGIKNVTCFTYGRKDTADVNISKEVAEALGYEWHYIEHTPKLIAGFIHDEDFQNYYRYMSRGTSMFYMQEYFALRELKRNNVIDKDFIAIPGHSGDLIGGSQFLKVIPPSDSISKLKSKILKKFYWYINLTPQEQEALLSEISLPIEQIKSSFPQYKDWQIMEDWLVRERIAKYVINSSQVFTFFGGEVRLPFWDNELFEYWTNMPISYRLNKLHYDKLLNNNWFKKYDIEIGENLQATKSKLYIQKIKSQLRPFLPKHTKEAYLRKNDWTLYNEITSAFLPDIEKSSIALRENQKSYVNRILTWYIIQLQQTYSIKLD